MDNSIKRLPDSELDIMLIVWRARKPISASYILERIRKKRRWALSSLMTVLSRLVNKGFLTCEKQGWNNVYSAAIEEAQYKEKEGKSILEKLYGNSFKNLVTALYNGKAIDKDDIEELRFFLDQIEEEK